MTYRQARPILSLNFGNVDTTYTIKKTPRRDLFSAPINILNSNNFNDEFFNFEMNNINDFGDDGDQEIAAIISDFRRNSTPTKKLPNFDDELGTDFLDEDVQVASASSNLYDYKICSNNKDNNTSIYYKKNNFVDKTYQLDAVDDTITIEDDDLVYQPTPKSISSRTRSISHNMFKTAPQTILKQSESGGAKRLRNNSFSTSASNNLTKRAPTLAKLRCSNCSPLTATIAAVASAKPTVNNKNTKTHYKRQSPAINLLKQTDNLLTTKQSTSSSFQIVRPQPIRLTKNNMKAHLQLNFNQQQQQKKNKTSKIKINNVVGSADSGISESSSEISNYEGNFTNYNVSCNYYCC